MASIPTLLIPKALKKGGTIAFISPSERLNEHFPTPLSRAVSFFQSLGYPVKVIYTPLPTVPSSPTTSLHLTKTSHIVQEIHAAFLDPQVTCIISTVGGTTINEILRIIDYGIVRSNPKIFVGYSDNTHLIYAFYTQAGLRSFTGPCALTEFAEFPAPDPFTVSHFFQVLRGDDPVTGTTTAGITGQRIPRSTSFAGWDLPFFLASGKEDTEEVREAVPTPPVVWLRPGTASGPIMGGTLRKLVSLSGTPYLPPKMHTGAIFFFEISQGEDQSAMPLYRVRSDIVDLINTGLFDDIVGLVVGRTSLYDEKMNKKLKEIIVELVEGGGWQWPVLFGVDIGHTSPMLTVPFGVRTRLDSVKDEFCFLEEGVV
ncbi:Uncharacterized protein BP5553_00821 [Venustampulla echinocandica]|uniref:Peptidase S66, LD-carboxypeptidase A n=1 Tax=Venustampulla echinocandica TaxID=2656787 RepID=A0A370TZ95_9HELO|nr:Uncharacterized protein BP5553_00821 [Venustampulla echinocandica]RDL40842.1 Uncharacterized protein BP5553_00821 [Venustampulla echinocandica]